jgi:hypothetical protein
MLKGENPVGGVRWKWMVRIKTEGARMVTSLSSTRMEYSLQEPEPYLVNDFYSAVRVGPHGGPGLVLGTCAIPSLKLTAICSVDFLAVRE